MPETVLIAGAGIGGLTAALCLHNAGRAVQVFEQAPALGELGVGINLLPHATRDLAALGLLPDLDKAGVRTQELTYANRFGQMVWREPRGIAAGYAMPQFSIHRGRLHALLASAVLQRLGPEAVRTGCRVVGFEGRAGCVVAKLRESAKGSASEIVGDALVGGDGIHSTVRRALFPAEGRPARNGVLLWRGTTPWPGFGTGASMLVAGGSVAKFVCYPIAHATTLSADRLTNWAVMARVPDDPQHPRQREDWQRLALHRDVLAFARDRFRLPDFDVEAIVRRTEVIYEYPNCDRDPLPRWSHERVTLLVMRHIRCTPSVATARARPSWMPWLCRGTSPHTRRSCRH